MDLKKTGIVIDAGIGGLAIAIRLASRGFVVKIFEANPYPGGKLSEIRSKGYRFDAGPSLFTLPGPADELFEECGKDPGQYFSCRKLESICRYHYEKGTIINAWQDIDRFAREPEEKTGVSAASLQDFLDRSRKLYELTSPVFIFRSFHRPGIRALRSGWSLLLTGC